MEQGFKFIEAEKIHTPEIYCDICDVLTSLGNLGFNKRFILPNGLVICYRCLQIAKGIPIDESKAELFLNYPHRDNYLGVIN